MYQDLQKAWFDLPTLRFEKVNNSDELVAIGPQLLARLGR